MSREAMVARPLGPRTHGSSCLCDSPKSVPHTYDCVQEFMRNQDKVYTQKKSRLKSRAVHGEQSS